MNKHNLIQIILTTVVIVVVALLILTTKTNWSLSDEKPGPKMIDCMFQGLWSPLLRVRIVVKQSCAGI